MVRALLLAATLGVASLQAQSLTTLAPNNGTGGVFLQLNPAATSFNLTGFSTSFGSTAGSAVTVEVWVRTGAYAAFTTSSEGWTLTQTLSGLSAGTVVEPRAAGIDF